MNSRLRNYSEIQRNGTDPLQAFQRYKTEGKDWLTCIKLVREEFGLSLAEAKEVMIISEKQADSLWEHQENLADSLKEAFPEEKN